MWLLACASEPALPIETGLDSWIVWDPPTLSLGRLHQPGDGGFVRTRDGLPIQQFRALGPEGVQAFTLDEDFQQLDSARLTPEGEDDGDPALTWDQDAIYQAAPKAGGERAVLRKFDADFDLLASVDFALDQDERFLDESITVDQGRVHLVSEHREAGETWVDNQPPSDEHLRGLHVRVFDTDLGAIEEHDLTAQLPGASPENQFWGLGSSQIWTEDGYLVFAQQSVGDEVTWPEGESRGGRAVFALLFDQDGLPMRTWGPLSPAGQDAYWPTGSLAQDGFLYVSYTFRRPEDGPVNGPPDPDQGNLALLVLDRDLQPVDRLVLTDLSSEQLAAHGGAHRSHLEAFEGGLWVSYDQDGRAWAQEVLLD